MGDAGYPDQKRITEIIIDSTAISEFETALSKQVLVENDSSVPLAYINAVIEGQKVDIIALIFMLNVKIVTD